MESLTPEKFRLRSFRLRGERMTKAQSEALLSHWNKFEIPVKGVIDPTEVFFGMKPDEVIMEIGSGMGEATAQIAAARPHSGYIAVEVHKPGIGALIIHAERLGIRNLRIIEGDIWEVLSNHWTDKSIDAFHIFFPDPWPKRKQNKRRLLRAEFISLLAQKLKPNGRVHIATDWVPYAEEIERNFALSSAFSGGVVQRPEWRPLTKFENKGLNKERRVTDFIYKRN